MTKLYNHTMIILRSYYDLIWSLYRLILSLARETVETRTGAVASSCRKKTKKELSSFVLGLIVQIVIRSIRSWIGFRAKRNNIMFLQVPTYSDNATISGRKSRSMLITRELKPTQSLQTQFRFSLPKVFDFSSELEQLPSIWHQLGLCFVLGVSCSNLVAIGAAGTSGTWHEASVSSFMNSWSSCCKELWPSHGFLPENQPC